MFLNEWLLYSNVKYLFSDKFLHSFSVCVRVRVCVCVRACVCECVGVCLNHSIVSGKKVVGQTKW